MPEMRWYAPLVAATAALLSPPTAGAQGPLPVAEQSPTSAEDVVRRLYDLVTFDAGTAPNWDEVRSLFLDDAVIVLRTGRDRTQVFSLEGWVNDFVSFIERANVEQTGFVERIVGLRTMVFKDMAYVMTLYEASIPGWERSPQQGVDLFLLTRQETGWRIAAITNDLPDEQNPIPSELRAP